MTNTPFVEVEKRDKFKVFIATKLLPQFWNKVSDVIYPYVNEDRAKLNDKGLFILKMNSYEDARLVADALYIYI